jgi:hypothetical protein
MKETKSVLVLVSIVLSILMASACTAEDCDRCHKDIVDNFSMSLHHTGSGMFDE